MMPKMKTHRGAAKRFNLTKKGKIKRAKAFKSHLLSHKSQKRKRRLRKPAFVSKADYKRILQLIPYK
ncbi:LSU ribosomal protein L35P [Caldanaerovirga acetigignens]|uniref:Large ribosomal subunit protein bL35 n=2 Tax=Caldanaerovirga acetigignens TaxID=447595 RepID=A0A1M7G6G8_9FIRM|nr:LSU ribosomal protein L35P [Caldanaerovirga acetigignens]